MVGRTAEAGGIAKDGAKMVNAVACAQVLQRAAHARLHFVCSCARALGAALGWLMG